MAKKVKMVIYGKPGEGKSTFASKSDNPLFICTDGNFEWLDLPDENHVRVSTWKQAKQVINDIVAERPEYKDFKTIVVDLIEDLYVWAEDEFCKREGIIHIGDYKSMGAGYSVVRKEFFAQISKLLSIDKNVILISHEADKIGKTKAGADTYTYIPSDKMSLTKQWNDIEGQVRYFLRCYSQEEEFEGRTIKKRYLSLVAGSNEYGIARGLDESNAPREIELDWNVFLTVIGLEPTKEEPVKEVKKTKPAKPKVEEPVVETPKAEEPAQKKSLTEILNEKKAAAKKPEPDEEVEDEDTEDSDEVVAPTQETTTEEVVVEVVTEPVKQPVDTSNLSPEERRKIVLARIEQMKKGK